MSWIRSILFAILQHFMFFLVTVIPVSTESGYIFARYNGQDIKHEIMLFATGDSDRGNHIIQATSYLHPL
jgi:hypothetical protein